MPGSFAVISYYTLGTMYEKEAEGLISSCQFFGYEYYIEGIKNLKAWDRNCCQKPGFILKKLLQLKKPILWIDIDAIILKKLDLFETITCELAVRIDEDRPLDHFARLRGGTIYVNYNKKMLKLMRLWKKECQNQLALSEGKKDVWDQACLHDVMFKSGLQVELQNLDVSYCRIFDWKRDLMPMEDTFILHCQASRLYKHIINQECVSFPFLQEMNSKDLKSMRYLLKN